MNEFKFNCPTCGQHILAAHEWIGRQIECPSCEKRITVAAPAKAPKKITPVKPAAPKAHLETPDDAIQTKPLAKVSKQPAAQTAPTPTPAKVSSSDKLRVACNELKTKAGSDAPPQTERLRTAVLTPAIKLDMVRAVRRRIADESSWLPGRIKDEHAYAAKVRQGETIIEDVSSPEATRFSLIGAFLLEFRLRNVARTATGRTNLLDEEIPGAMREVLLDGMNAEAREEGKDPLANKSRKPLSHAQCLAVLDILEERYSQRVEQVRIEKSERTLAKVRLPDLVEKLKSKARVTPEDVATALYHELMDVRRRLDQLESQSDPDK